MRRYIIGMLMGIVLATSISAHAEVINMIGKVIDGSFPITIKGVTLQNPAITIAGVSYVPTREFAESLGATVKFDANLGIEVVPTSTPSPSATPTPAPAYDPSTDPRNIKAKKVIELQKRTSDITKAIEPLYNEYNKYDKKKMDNPSTFTDEDALQAAKKAWENKQAELTDAYNQLDALQKQP